MRKIGQIFRFLIPVIALVVLVVFMTGAGRRERATLKKNKAIAMRIVEIWEKRDMAAFDDIYASNYIRHEDAQPEGILRGREAVKQHAMNCYTAWPDFHITSEDVIVQGDEAAIRWAIRGTFTGAVKGWPPPTGKEMAFEGISMVHFAGGKVVEEWCFDQDLVMFYGMGMKLVPAQQPAGK